VFVRVAPLIELTKKADVVSDEKVLIAEPAGG
jgi:hypothetical protein